MLLMPNPTFSSRAAKNCEEVEKSAAAIFRGAGTHMGVFLKSNQYFSWQWRNIIAR
jgi:hypothetical protein